MMRLALLAFIFAAGLAAQPVAAQEKINKPVRLVVGFAAGGSVDLVARMIGERLSPRLGQPVRRGFPPRRQAAHRRGLRRGALARAARRAHLQGAGRAHGSSLGYGVFAPAGTPPAIVAELTERSVSLGLDPAAAGPKVAAETLAADFARWRPIVQQAGFRLD